MNVGHGHPGEMGCRDVVSEENRVRIWHSLGQIVVEI
jgi:hypothetical protein